MSPDADWRDLDPATLTRAYDNAGAVPDSAARLAGWRERSAELRRRRPWELDLAYGPRPRNRIDLFRAGPQDAPLLAFIHGGYWQRNAKEGFACMAEGPLALGLDVALVGYTLAPEATLTEIADEIGAALRFLRHGSGRGRRFVVAGWSAGGHLAALAGASPAADAILSISGLFDLAPIRRTDLDTALRLTETEVEALSPIRRIGRRFAPSVIAYGGRELPELCRQSFAYHAACWEAGHPARLIAIEDHDHFSILETMISPEGTLARAAAELAGR